jgi:hypothetical protein
MNSAAFGTYVPSFAPAHPLILQMTFIGQCARMLYGRPKFPAPPERPCFQPYTAVFPSQHGYEAADGKSNTHVCTVEIFSTYVIFLMEVKAQACTTNLCEPSNDMRYHSPHRRRYLCHHRPCPQGPGVFGRVARLRFCPRPPPSTLTGRPSMSTTQDSPSFGGRIPGVQRHHAITAGSCLTGCVSSLLCVQT